MSEQKNRVLDKKWISFGTLMLGAGTIYKLGFLKDAFYVPMQEFMGLSHTQIGTAMSIAGLISTFGFLASIYLTDRISKKIMIPLSLVSICLCGLWLSTFPSYPVFLLIYCLLAICADMLYWPTMLKTVRLLGNEDEQGRMFGIMEAGRGLMDTIVAFCALGIFSAFGSNATGLRMAILFYSIVPGIIGIIMYFLLEPDAKPVKAAETGDHVSANKQAWEGVVRALKDKRIWLVSFNIFFVYSVYCGLTYFIPFLQEAYALPAALIGAYGIINQYGLKMLGGPVGGIVSDKVLHSATKYLQILFVIVAASLAIFSFLPHQNMSIILGMTITLCISACVFSMRAIFFAPMDEVGVPREITGSTMSIGSFIGYLPGAFMYAVYGNILDRTEGLAGYRAVFFIMAAFAVAGFLLSSFILKNVKKQNQA
ncbi:MFS transporter [Clostridium sp. AN503]|uniref:MFS transporter n=1 Tax=Clostridium sp. AN503 TaxID=3160598 RepID=UPI0034580F63